nr:hypothetical protein [Tanacetum cinerariifolium]
NGKPNNFDKGRSGPGYRRSNDSSRSYVNAVNDTPSGSSISASLALVLDGNCIVEKDFTKHARGRVKDASSILNLQEAESSSDVESIHGERLNDDNLSFASEEEEGEFNASNAEGVAETVFG